MDGRQRRADGYSSSRSRTNPSDVKSPTFAFTVNEGGSVSASSTRRLQRMHLAEELHEPRRRRYVFTVKSTDAAGNTGQTAYSWRIETKLPVATLSR